MKLIFDHTFGKVEHQDLVICHPLAEVMEEEENEAIEAGWLASDVPFKGKEMFYQSRSTRINLDCYKQRFKSHKLNGKQLKVKEIEANEMVKLIGLPKIYHAFMKRKKFTIDYNPFNHYHGRDSFLIFYTETPDKIIAFTKLKKYHYQEDVGGFGGYTQQLGDDDDDDNFNRDNIFWAGYESVIHCNLNPISQLTLDIELQWAKEHKAAYFYMGSGYEVSSMYKSKWTGFQWWTGTKWSKSKKLYQKLCRSDSRVQSLQDVSKIPSLLPHIS
jgi:hypothetical protein